MDLERLLKHPPTLHTDRAGNLISWGASSRLLRYLDNSLQEGQVTLETGAGLSTIVFALKRCHHTAIVPDKAQVKRIKSWCDNNGIATDRLNFIVNTSQNALPNLDIPSQLDLCLIDGAHGFPLPFIDWFYTVQHLRPGGVVIIDDLQIWTGQVLYKFLSMEPNWAIDHLERLEFLAAHQIASSRYSEWNEQPYVLRKSITINSSSPIRRILGYVFTGYRLASSTVSIALRGDWKELRRRLDIFRRS